MKVAFDCLRKSGEQRNFWIIIVISLGSRGRRFESARPDFSNCVRFKYFVPLSFSHIFSQHMFPHSKPSTPPLDTGAVN